MAAAKPEADKAVAKPKKKNPYRLYQAKPVEMRPFNESLGLGADVRARITPDQLKTGSPKPGDMIAKRADGQEYLVTAEAFAEHFESRPLS